MSRRSALPGADELFRSTGGRSGPDADGADEFATDRLPSALPAGGRPGPARPAPQGVDLAPAPGPLVSPGDDPEHGSDPHGELDALAEAADSVRPTARRRPRAMAERRPSGRERHEEKITVYVSQDELMDLEHARLMLRGDHGLPVDRGRVVREALAVVLADFEAKGDASILVRRLRGH